MTRSHLITQIHVKPYFLGNVLKSSTGQKSLLDVTKEQMNIQMEETYISMCKDGGNGSRSEFITLVKTDKKCFDHIFGPQIFKIPTSS